MSEALQAKTKTAIVPYRSLVRELARRLPIKTVVGWTRIITDEEAIGKIRPACVSNVWQPGRFAAKAM
jgi:hypothetical protein